MHLTDNTVLVTGGGTGIGRGLAEAFHELGNQVIIAGRRREPLASVAEANPGMQYSTLDKADAADVARFAADVTERFPTLNVLINNAGVQPVEDLTAGDVEAAEQTIATNLLGPIRLTAALLPHLLRQPRAAIVNVTSGLAFMPHALTPTYSASKAALHSYTQSLRFQLRDTDVDVIELIPPKVQTGLQQFGPEFDPAAMPLQDYLDETMALLRVQPQAEEILVERVKGFRFAERDGTFDDVCRRLNTATAGHLNASTHSQSPTD